MTIRNFFAPQQNHMCARSLSQLNPSNQYPNCSDPAHVRERVNPPLAKSAHLSRPIDSPSAPRASHHFVQATVEVLVPFKLFLLSEDAGVYHLAAEGEATALDFTAAGPSAFEQILGPNWTARRVLLDMDRLSYLDSTAIGWLITSQKAFRSGGGFLAMHSLQPQVRNLLNLLKFERVVPMAEHAQAGLEAIPEPAPAKRARRKASVS
ncbi:MAG TPA: STAS domain-containing protein [Phycisphaerae bacterium]|nr:STAS domain-containing protein [Phycisphaerae bacterium]